MAHIRKSDPAYGYFDYLLDRVGVSRRDREDYSMLFDYLYLAPFRWSIGNDMNREMDGFALREEYFDEIGDSVDNSEINYRGCTVLEMMVALAEKIEFNIMGEPDNDEPVRWIWVMIKNLGLNKYDDLNWDCDNVDYIVQKWLDRRFEKNGEGSIFPVKDREKNYRRVEIWFQMCQYLDENYSILE